MRDEHYAKMILEVVPKSMRTIMTEMRESARTECTVAQFRILNKLAVSRVTNGELAEWMGVSAPTMSRMVDALVRKKLVRRSNVTLDRRCVHLQLTPKGQEKFNEISDQVKKKLAGRLSMLQPGVKEGLAVGLEVLREMFR